MNTKLLLIAISVTAFSSCTTLYKSGQTPDDVYFSPVRGNGGEYVDVRKQQPRDEGNYYSSEDRTIRLGINDARWRYLDYNYNYSNNLYINDYSYNPYNYGYNYGYYYNPYFWPYPVYSYGTVYGKPSIVKNATPRMTNLSGYQPVNNNLRTTSHGGLVPVRSYNNTNRGSAVGNAIRQIFSPSNSSNSSNNVSTPTNNNRTYAPVNNSNSSSSSSGRSSASAGSGSVSRPPRN